MKKSIFNNYIKYVSLNVLGMIGTSYYILADTFFISKALGTTGIAALNLSIPIYTIIHGIGLIIGIGGANKYSVLKSQNEDKKANIVFTTSIKIGIITGIILTVLGVFGSKNLALILGSDKYTFPMTKTYLMTILCFAPFYIIKFILIAFVCNDNNPKLSMVAMLIGSFSNIILEYLFMFPLKMGIFGAAFSMSIASMISIGILLSHFPTTKNNLVFIRTRIWSSIWNNILCFGLSSFITEVSSAIIVISFNIVILRLKGNLGVAAYGIIANISFVVVSILTGIAQGAQPLISSTYGLRNNMILKKLLKYALITSLLTTLIIYSVLYFYADNIVTFFNSENNVELAHIAKTGLHIYFIGTFFMGFNIIIAMYLSAIEKPKDAFIISILRGCIIIIPMVILLSKIWDMVGVWLAFVFTECIVTVLATYIVIAKLKNCR